MRHIEARADDNSCADLTVIVLTFNEEKHLARCLKSVHGLAKDLVIIDSGSTDRTQEIAIEYSAKLLVHPFVNHALQFNWGLEHAEIRTSWVMRLDADEVVTQRLHESLCEMLSSMPEETAGLTVNRKIQFLGRWISHGGVYPIRTLRLWRNGLGHCENRWMDEHILVKGDIRHLNADIADINLNNVSWWINKHNQYATREAIELLLNNKRMPQEVNVSMSTNVRIKRWVKYSIYCRIPLWLRSFFYFIYRYFFQLGFMDGFEGFVFHFMQGFWYRLLVDVKCYELVMMMRERKQSLREVVKNEYGYDL